MNLLRRIVIPGLALAALVGMPVAAGAAATNALVPADEPTELALPDHIGIPWLWTPTVYQSAAQPTGLIFGGQSLSMVTLLDEDTNVVMAGGDDDVYRLLPLSGYATAGEDVLLSPDGTKVAHSGAHIFDLRTNETVVLPQPYARTEYAQFLAWSPDGSRVAVASDSPDRAEVGVMDVASGSYRHLGTVNDTFALHGAAFTPDGTRLTYQDEQTVTTVRLDGTPQSSFTVAADTYLAGKGAWRPDNTAVTLSVKTATGWQLRVVDPATGDPVPGQNYPVVEDATALRLLGWQHGSIPVALAFRPDSDAPAKLDRFEMTSYEYLRSVDVLRLPRDAGRAEVVLAAPDDVHEIDIADQVIASGAVRPGDGAPFFPARPRWAAFGAFLATALLLVVIRRVRRMRTVQDAGRP